LYKCNFIPYIFLDIFFLDCFVSSTEIVINSLYFFSLSLSLFLSVSIQPQGQGSGEEGETFDRVLKALYEISFEIIFLNELFIFSPSSKIFFGGGGRGGLVWGCLSSRISGVPAGLFYCEITTVYYYSLKKKRKKKRIAAGNASILMNNCIRIVKKKEKEKKKKKKGEKKEENI